MLVYILRIMFHSPRVRGCSEGVKGCPGVGAEEHVCVYVCVCVCVCVCVACVCVRVYACVCARAWCARLGYNECLLTYQHQSPVRQCIHTSIYP